MTTILNANVDDLDRIGDVTAIHPEALSTLLAPTPSGTAHGNGQVVFSYLNHTVRVFSSGRIENRPCNDSK